MKELKPGEFLRLEAFYNRKKQHLPALSVLKGIYPGRVFVNRTDNPDLAVVWATGRWMWETTHENTASHRLASKLGFIPVEQYPVYSFQIHK